MKKRFFILIVSAVLLAGAAPVHAETGMGIAAVVNQEAISGTDVQERMRLVIVSSGLPETKAVQQKILPQVLDGLIDEQLQMQEASRNELTVTDEEIAEGFGKIAANNKMTAEQFGQVMKQAGIPKNTLMRQIRAQIAWQKVVQKVVRPLVSVSPNDVAALEKRMEKNFGKTEYLVSEIFLPVDDDKGAAEVRQFAGQLVSEVQAKRAPFAGLAAQFSRAPGAEKGGDIGWVQEGRLDEELDAALRSLAEGAVSQPIRGINGYHILWLRQKRTFTEGSIPSQDDLTNQIGFERLDRAQQRYLSDLKAAAFIDRRV